MRQWWHRGHQWLQILQNSQAASAGLGKGSAAQQVPLGSGDLSLELCGNSLLWGPPSLSGEIHPNPGQQQKFLQLLPFQAPRFLPNKEAAHKHHQVCACPGIEGKFPSGFGLPVQG